MASIEKTVEVIFAGRDDVTRVMRTIRGGLTDLEGVVEAVATPLARVADAVLAADAALAGLAAGGLALAIKKAGDFSDSVNEIYTLVDATADQVAGFRQAILDYARTSTAGIDEITGAIYTAVSAGTDWRDSVALVAQAEKLATAGRADLEATTRLLVSTLNAYGASTDEVTRYSDVFFQTVRDGQTTLPDLADKLGAVVGLAASAGVDIEDLAAAIATLTVNGVQTDQAVTALRATLSALLKPTKEAADTAKQLGVDFGAGAVQAKGLAGVLADVAQATGGSADQIAKLFPNVRALNAVLVLTSDDGLKRLNEELGKMRNAAGATDAAFEKMAANFDQVTQNLKNNVTATLAQLGQPFLDDFNDIAEAISAVFDAVGQSFDAGSFDPLIQMVEDAAAAIDSLLDNIAANLPQALGQIDWSPITDNLRDFGDALAQLFDGLDLTTAEGLRKAIQGTVDTIGSLITVTQGIAQQLGPVAKQVVELIAEFNRLPDTLKVQVGDILGLGKIIDSFGAKLTVALKVMQSFDQSATLMTAGLTGLNLGWQKLTGSQQDYENALIAHQITMARLTGKMDMLRMLADELGLDFEELRQWVEGADAAQANLADTFDRTTAVLRSYTPALDAVQASSDAVAESQFSVTQQLDDLDQMLADVAAELNRKIDADRKAAEANRTLDDATYGVVQRIGDLVRTAGGVWTQLPRAADAIRATGTAADEASQRFKQATQDSEDFRLKMAALKADFAKTALKLDVDLQVARVQAEAQQITSIMQGLSGSFQSVTQAIGTMTGQWASMVGGNLSQWTASGQLWTLIQQQAQMQQQYTQAQIQLTQAQVQALRARTQALQSGQALIQIDGTGLAPSLQMVMWEILEQVQLRVNQSAADLLMGI